MLSSVSGGVGVRFLMSRRFSSRGTSPTRPSIGLVYVGVRRWGVTYNAALLDGRDPVEGLLQFVPLAVVADRRRRGRILPDAEGGEVVDDRPEGPRVRPHPDHLVGVQTRLDGRLGEVGVDVEVAVEEQVADDADALAAEGGQDLVDERVRKHEIRLLFARGRRLHGYLGPGGEAAPHRVLGDHPRQDELQQVIRPARLRADARQLEPAERLAVHQRPGASCG